MGEDEMSRLTEKVTINLNSYERDFLVKLQKETGVPLSTYLRRKLLEINAFSR